MTIEEVIIIGAGPAGLAAALQLKRYGIDPLIFEQERFGGLLHNANLVENYPGFPGGIPGPELIQLFEEQFKDYDLRLREAGVLQVNHQANFFTSSTALREYHSRILVIASGTKPRQFKDIEIPADLQERVFYEVYPLLGQVGIGNFFRSGICGVCRGLGKTNGR